MPTNKKPTYEATRLKYVLECTYSPDWEFVRPNQTYFYLETKGNLDSIARRKMLAVKRQNPDIDVRFVFQRDNYLYKGSKKKYSDWAEEHGFPWHVVGATSRYIPDAWLKEAKAFTVCNKKFKAQE